MAEDMVIDSAQNDGQLDSALPADDNISVEMDSEDDVVGKDRKLTADGGVVKKLLRAGDGWESPEKGDKVQVHYTGTLLDGTKFDSSVDRGEPFEFELGVGQVIKGWDVGVASMKRGEKALLTCRSDYAYGKQGSPPKIPADATLNFEVELLSWTSQKDISGDGGVIKTIVQEGTGYQRPNDRDEVQVRYKVRAEGSDAVIAESPEEGIEFALGEGHLCKGLQGALKTMLQGEQARLQLKSDYATLTDATAAAAAPAGTPLDVEVELLGWKHVEDVTPDKQVVKKTLREGDKDSYKKPNDGATATIRYTARLVEPATAAAAAGLATATGPIIDERQGDDALTFTIDTEAVPEGLELALQQMKRGERALVNVGPKYGYGEAAEAAAPRGSVPAGSTVQYDVELVDFTNTPETWEMNNDDKIAAASARKEKGNKAYKENKLDRAIKQYEKGASLIQYDKDFSEELKHQSKDIKKSCWLNLAAAQLKRKQYQEVIQNCDKVLGVDPTNVKALYRRAQAHLANRDLVEAELDVKAGLEEEPGNADLLQLQKRVKAVAKAENQKAAQIYGKMFKKVAVTAGAAGKDVTSHQIDVGNE